MKGYFIGDAASSIEITENLVVSAGGYVIFGRNMDSGANGGLIVDYEFSFFLNNTSDDVIISCDGMVIDQVSYDNGAAFPDPSGASMSLLPDKIDASQNDNGANWCTATTTFGDGDLGTPGAANNCSLPAVCSISNASIQNDSCQGMDFFFEVTFDTTATSGSFQVINATTEAVLATGNSAPIAVTLPNNSDETAFNIQVRDAADNTCISTSVVVNPQNCTPIPCAISNVSIQNGTCQETDYVFEVSFNVLSGSGNYEVVKSANDSVMATGSSSPIQVTLIGNTDTTTFDIYVRDAADTNCKSETIMLTPENCVGLICVGVGSLIITEIMQNPTGTEAEREWFEVYNASGIDIDLMGYHISDAGSSMQEINESLLIAADGYVVFGRSKDMSLNGGVAVDYEFNFFLNNNTDEISILCEEMLIDKVAYDDGATFPDPSGASMSLKPLQYDAILNDDGLNWCVTDSIFGGGDRGTPGKINNCTADDCFNTPLIIDFVSQTPPRCGNKGTIRIAAYRGTDVLEYSIDSGNTWQNENIFREVSIGDYQVKVRSPLAGCVEEDAPFTFTDDCNCPEVMLNLQQLSTCTSEDAAITIRAEGGDLPLEYVEYSLNGKDWGTTRVFTDLEANLVYRPAIRYTTGACRTSQEVVFYRPSIPSINSPSFSHPTCEASDGAISIQTSGGAGNLEFSIDGGEIWQSNPTFTNLPEGTYQMTARNTGSTCQAASESIFLNAPNEPIITAIITTDPSDCNLQDGRLEIQLSNTDRPVEYSIFSNNEIPRWEADSIFENLSTFTYRPKVRNIEFYDICPKPSEYIRIKRMIIPLICYALKN